jgi:hypothetical protein
VACVRIVFVDAQLGHTGGAGTFTVLIAFVCSSGLTRTKNESGRIRTAPNREELTNDSAGLSCGNIGDGRLADSSSVLVAVMTTGCL